MSIFYYQASEISRITAIHFDCYFVKFTTTNIELTFALIVSSVFLTVRFFNINYKEFYYKKTDCYTPKYQIFLKLLLLFIIQSITESITHKEGQKYVNFLISIFIYILILNLVGLLPFAFSINSFFISTFFLSNVIFLYVNARAFLTNINFLLFNIVPSRVDPLYLLLLVPLELISYLIRPVSLGLRLSSNMFATVIIMKILSGIFFYIIAPFKISLYYTSLSLLLFVLFAFIILMEMILNIVQTVVYLTIFSVYISNTLCV